MKYFSAGTYINIGDNMSDKLKRLKFRIKTLKIGKYFVLFILIFIKSYVILAHIGNEDKQMWFATFYP